MNGKENPAQKILLLGRNEKCWSVGLALLLFVGAAVLHTKQPRVKTTETTSDGTWKTVEKPVESTSLALCLYLLAGGFFFYAVNGLKIVSFSFGDVAIAATTANDADEIVQRSKVDLSKEDEADPAYPPPEPTARPEIVRTRSGEFEIYQLSEVPQPVLNAAFANWPKENRPPTDWADFVFALRKPGRGNHKWVIRLRDRAPVIVAYGGKGKDVPTVTTAW